MALQRFLLTNIIPPNLKTGWLKCYFYVIPTSDITPTIFWFTTMPASFTDYKFHYVKSFVPAIEVGKWAKLSLPPVFIKQFNWNTYAPSFAIVTETNILVHKA